MRSNKEKIVIFVIVVALTLGYWYALAVFSKIPSESSVSPVDAAEKVPAIALEKISPVIIEKTNDTPAADTRPSVTIIINGVSHVAAVSNDRTLYNVMVSLKNNAALEFHAIPYPALGQFIDSINGIKNSNDTYWVYYINGVSATVGVSSYIVKPNDVIEWKFEKSKL